MMKKISAIILSAFLFSGCLKENRGDCPVMTVRFGLSYTLNTDNAERLAELANHIRIYIFDCAGDFVDELHAGTEDIARGYVDHTLPAGRYTAVAWGTSGTDLESAGYRTVVAPGVARAGGPITRLDEFQLAVTRPEGFDELFHAMDNKIKIVEKELTFVPLSFTRHTNLLRVKIFNLDKLPASDSPLDIYVTGRKDLYGYDGFVHANSTTQRFGEAVTPTQTHDVWLQRLDLGFHHGESGDPLMLNIERDGQPLVPALNLIETIMQSPAYNTQTDLDREHEFDLDIYVHVDRVVAGIVVNGYTIFEIVPVLDQM